MQSLIMRARTSFLATWRSLVCVRDVGWSVGSPKIVLSRSAKVYSQPPAPRIIYVLKSVSETERKAKHVKKKKKRRERSLHRRRSCAACRRQASQDASISFYRYISRALGSNKNRTNSHTMNPFDGDFREPVVNRHKV